MGLTGAKNVDVRVGLDPSGYISGSEKLSYAAAKQRREFESAERRWRTLQGQHQAALDQQVAREQAATAAAQKQADARNKAYTKLAIVGAAAAVAAGAAVKKFADFDQAVSGINASGPDAAANLDALRAAALRAGKDTQYSATEAADAVTELAKAGVSAKDILAGGLDGALALAAAGQMGVADAAAVTSKVLNQFSMTGDKATHVADVLAASAGKANGEVSDFGTAMEYVGPQASAMGVSLEETSGTLAVLAQNGLLADKAGTGLRGVLVALAAPTKRAQIAMDKYGISAYDSQGKFVGVASLAGQLEEKLGGLSDAQQNAALKTIFSNAQLSTAQVLMKGGAGEIKKWTAAVDDQGFAAETAAKKMDNLKGDIEKLSGSFETVLIQSGSGANDVLRTMVQRATSLVDAIGGIPEPVLNAITLIAGGGGLALMGVAAFGKLSTSVKTARKSFDELGTSGKRATKIIGGVASGILLVASAMSAVPKDSAKGVNAMADALERIGKSGDVSALFEGMDGGDWFTGQMDDFDALVDYMASPSTWDNVNESIDKFANGIGGLFGQDWRGAWDKQQDTLKAYGDQLATMAQADLPAARAAFASMWQAAGGSDDDAAQLLRIFPAFKDALVGIASTAGLATDDQTLLAIATGQVAVSASDAAGATGASKSAIEQYSSAAATGTATSEDYTDALKEQIDAQKEAAGIVLSARDAERGYQESIDDASEAIDDYRKGLVEKYEKQGMSTAAAKAAADADIKAGKALDIHTEAGRTNQEKLDGIVESTWTRIDALREEGASEDTLQGKMKKSREQYIKAAEKMGLSKDKAEELADTLGLIPSQVGIKVTDDGIVTASQHAQDLLDKLTKIQNVPNYVEVGASRPVNKKNLTKPSKAPTESAAPAFAGGGAVVGPGTGTSDSVKGASLSNGEHVVPADEVKDAGGQKGMYRLRGLLRAGLLSFAVGGAVGDALAERKAAKAAVDKAKAEATAAQKAQDAAQKTYDHIDGTKANKTKKSAAKDALTAAKKATKQKNEALADARDARDAAKAKISTLRGLRSDLATDVRRGDTVESVTSGSGLSVVDQMYEWASNKALSSKARKNLRSAAADYEKQLDDVYKRLDTAKDRADALQQIADSVTGTLTGEFSLGDSLGQDAYGYTAAVTADTLVTNGSAVRDRILAFGGKLKKLQKAGASLATLQEVAKLGSEQGSQVADALLADTSKIGQLNGIYSEIDTYSGQAAQYVTAGDGKGGLAAANTAVATLEAQAKSIGEQMAETFANSLEFTVDGGKLKVKKKVKRAAGGWIQGQGHGRSDSVDLEGSAGEFVVSAAGARVNRAVLPAINAGYRLPIMQPVPVMHRGPSAADLASVAEAAAAAATASVAAAAPISRSDLAAAMSGMTLVINNTVGLSRGTKAQLVIEGVEAAREAGAVVKGDLL